MTFSPKARRAIVLAVAAVFAAGVGAKSLYADDANKKADQKQSAAKEKKSADEKPRTGVNGGRPDPVSNY